MYPTRASYKPWFLNCLLYMCSTPQKQPAATVAVWAPGGTAIGCAGADDMDVKGRRKRVKKDMDA